MMSRILEVFVISLALVIVMILTDLNLRMYLEDPSICNAVEDYQTYQEQDVYLP